MMVLKRSVTENIHYLKFCTFLTWSENIVSLRSLEKIIYIWYFMLNQITTQPWRKGNPTSQLSAFHKMSFVFGEMFGFWFFINNAENDEYNDDGEEEEPDVEEEGEEINLE